MRGVMPVGVRLSSSSGVNGGFLDIVVIGSEIRVGLANIIGDRTVRLEHRSV